MNDFCFGVSEPGAALHLYFWQFNVIVMEHGRVMTNKWTSPLDRLREFANGFGPHILLQTNYVMPSGLTK